MSAVVVPLEHVLAVAALLFCCGLGGLLLRRNLLFMLMSLEVMLNAAALAFIAGGARFAAADGQVMYLLILAVAAAEVAVGLALLLQVQRRFHSLDMDAVRDLRR
ncbi:MAG: NADH-quinone oxidoreductase subunit NuoK [Chromatocurvus sp.]